MNAMQFVESSVTGVRAAYLRLSAGPSSAEVCLLPMMHVGTASYFAEVRRRLDGCDVVLFEGVQTFHSWLLTRSYAIATHRKRLGLVLQWDALRTASLKPQRIHADVSSAEFAAAWRDIPLFQRVAVLLLAPLLDLLHRNAKIDRSTLERRGRRVERGPGSLRRTAGTRSGDQDTP
jgi:hypothetical protein